MKDESVFGVYANTACWQGSTYMCTKVANHTSWNITYMRKDMIVQAELKYLVAGVIIEQLARERL